MSLFCHDDGDNISKDNNCYSFIAEMVQSLREALNQERSLCCIRVHMYHTHTEFNSCLHQIFCGSTKSTNQLTFIVLFSGELLQFCGAGISMHGLWKGWEREEKRLLFSAHWLYGSSISTWEMKGSRGCLMGKMISTANTICGLLHWTFITVQ